MHNELENVWCSMDGLKSYLQKLSSTTIKEQFDNGQKANHFVSSVIYFCPDGTVPIAFFNTLGSVHWQLFVLKLHLLLTNFHFLVLSVFILLLLHHHEWHHILEWKFTILTGCFMFQFLCTGTAYGSVKCIGGWNRRSTQQFTAGAFCSILNCNLFLNWILAIFWIIFFFVCVKLNIAKEPKNNWWIISFNVPCLLTLLVFFLCVF